MNNGRAHPYLAQLPLTVSPFINLPKPATLPYTYKSLPSALPPSSTGEEQSLPTDPANPAAPTDEADSSAPGAGASASASLPKFVVSPSGHAAHPSEIAASVATLQAHLAKQTADAEREVAAWLGGIRERELAEKRRVAPGWLDREERMLVPEKKAGGRSLLDGGVEGEAGGSGGSGGGGDGQGRGKRPEGLGRSLTEERRDEGAELDRAFGGLK